MARIEARSSSATPWMWCLATLLTRATSRSSTCALCGRRRSPRGLWGKGTRFRPAVASMGRTAEMLIECTGHDRPTLFAATTTMQPQATGMSTTTRRTPHCPSRERSPRSSPPILSRRRGTSICSASTSTTKTWRRRGSGSASTWMPSAGTAPASHRTWISKSREAPQFRSGRSQS